MSDVIRRAIIFAHAAHAAIDQRRKYTQEPYINHPARVAMLVASVTNDRNMIAAAWLHDVVEDTKIPLTLIEQSFGRDIAELVAELTDVATKEDGNRATRVTLNRQHTALASARAQTIKLADLIDNTDDIVKHDARFARVYLKEKSDLLQVLWKGNAELWNRAYEQVAAGLKDLT